MGLEARLYSYRTVSGLEVDLLIEIPKGILGVETKNRERTTPRDARPMKAVAEALGPRWLGGIVVYRGGPIINLEPRSSIWAVPAHRLF